MSRFRVLHTPVTSVPNDFAICTAKVPTPPRRAIDQDLLAGLNLSFVAKTLQSGDSRYGNRSRLLEGYVRGFERDRAIGQDAHILGQGSVFPTEHLIARFELRHILADRLDPPCEVLAPDVSLRCAEPEGQAAQVRKAGHDMPVPDECARGENAEQHVVADRRPVDVLEPQDICRAVPVLDDRLHGVSAEGTVDDDLVQSALQDGELLIIELRDEQLADAARVDRRGLG